MDFAYFLNILLRRKWLILSVIILAAGTTWYFIGKLPPTFKSTATISTGIVEFKGRTLTGEFSFIQQYMITASFNQMMQDMTSRNSLKLLTNRLLEHDLSSNGGSKRPFRIPEGELIGLNQAQMDDVAVVLQTSNPDSLDVPPDFEKNNKKLAEAFGYDYESLVKSLAVKRIGDTDYLEISFTSENPELSYFAVRTFCDEFFTLFHDVLSYEQNESVAFYTKLEEKARHAKNDKLEEINAFKRRYGLIDVETEGESLIGQIKEIESHREEERKKIIPLRSAIKTLEEKILDYNRFFSNTYASELYQNDDYMNLDRQIKALQDDYVNGKKDKEAIKKRIEKLQKRKTELVAEMARMKTNDDNPIHDQIPNWLTSKLEKEIELDFVLAAVDSYEKELIAMKGRSGRIQNSNAVLDRLERELETLEESYIKTNTDLQEAILKAEGTKNPLAILEVPQLPEKAESSHRTVFAAFAGVAGGSMTSVFIFLLAFFDTSVQSPTQFQKMTRLPLLGFVNKIKAKKLDFHYLFHADDAKKELELFRESIRKLRSAIEASNSRSYLFVSPKEQEGKSFLVILLAYALSLNNRRVLIIDTNFRNNTLSNYKNTPFWTLTEDAPSSGFFKRLGSGQKGLPPKDNENSADFHLKNIDIIGNKGGNQSPSEVLAGKDFQKIMRNYSTRYDYIFLEAASMNQYSDAMELMRFVDKVVAVFSSESPLKSQDKETIAFLRRLDTKFLGGILNQVDLKNVG